MARKQLTRKVKSSAQQLMRNGIVSAVDGYSSSKQCSDVQLEISNTERPEILTFKVSEPAKNSTYEMEMDWQKLTKAGTEPSSTIRIADKMTANAHKLVAYINQTIYAK
ncbi:unnamed protein product [Gongylonema pulchrum]|uniref:Uncharacterized protein n=1 Tax=Gongylonema pulchrum TaxID=637853 RepID=A0A3P7NHM1_9BILA|nr:unnamed protein product [Gongylonema pulchrum]